jgi:hypothetical protein
MTEEVSRREFVKMAGVAVGGIALGAIGGYSLVTPKETIIEKEVEVPQEVPEYPWEYKKLDVEAVKDRAYAAYFEGGCAYGTFEGIVGELKEVVGFPYTTIPTKMAVWGKGGIVGWGLTCGAITGAGMALNLVTDDLAPVNEIVGWYTTEEMPQYMPAVGRKVEGELIKSVSGSPLCHASVSSYTSAADCEENSPERAERCGRLVADTAGKVAEMLNALADGTFTSTFQVPASVAECLSCHGADGPINNVFTKMDCTPCHSDPHTN